MNTEAKDGQMYCAVEGCGLVDDTHSAHCIKHGRSTHKIKGEKKTTKELEADLILAEKINNQEWVTQLKAKLQKTPTLKCEYPSCNKEGKYRHALQLVNEDNASVELPFCKYHFYVVIGGHFKARIHNKAQNLLGEKKETSFELLGPLQEVEIAEQVIGAREMVAALTGKLKEGK